MSKVKVLRKAPLKKDAGHCSEEQVMRLHIPFRWQICSLSQREVVIS